jgi:GT2 family glycosyltransferase
MFAPEYPSVSVVVCHNQGDLILKAIASLRIQKYCNVELIVATSDPKRTFYGTKTFYQKGGPDIKRNSALRLCSHDLIAFFDDDIEATPACVAKMARKLNDHLDVGMVFGKTLNMEHRDTFDEAGSFLTWTGFLWARGDRQKDIGQFDVCEPVLAGKSASCMIKRKVFVEVGKFDTDYEILGEETDLAWRVWLKGYKVLYTPRSVAFHAFNTRFKPRDMYTHSRIYFNGCRNYLSMLFTNLSSRNLIRIMPVHCLFWIGAGMAQLMTGKFKAGSYIILGITQFLKMLPRLSHKRKLVQSTRVVSDTDLFKIIMRQPSWTYYAKRLISYVRTGLHG